jgi:IS30 family transposase
MRLTKVHKYAICYLHSIGKSHAEIADEINTSERTIDRYLKKLSENTKEIVEELEAVPEVKKPTVSDFLLNKTQSGDTRGVMIMTKQASAIAENITKNLSAPSTNGVFRPKG